MKNVLFCDYVSIYPIIEIVSHFESITPSNSTGLQSKYFQKNTSKNIFLTKDFAESFQKHLKNNETKVTDVNGCHFRLQ